MEEIIRRTISGIRVFEKWQKINYFKNLHAIKISPPLLGPFACQKLTIKTEIRE